MKLSYIIVIFLFFSSLLSMSISNQNLTGDQECSIFVNEIKKKSLSKYPINGLSNGLEALLTENSSNNLRTQYGIFDSWLTLNYKDLVGATSDFILNYPDPPSSLFKRQWLVDHGITIGVQLFGAPFNPFTAVYNQTYAQNLVTQEINYFKQVIWSKYAEFIVLGDEVPATLFNWQNPSPILPEVIPYNNTFHNETGIYLRNNYNGTENWIFHQWFIRRLADGLNIIYDYFKSEFPNKSIFWGVLPWEGYEPTLVKNDIVFGGYYTSDFRDFYAKIRNAKLIAQDKPVLSIINGVSDPLSSTSFPKDKQNQFFWTNYFTGGNILAWFGGGNNEHWSNYGDEGGFASYLFHNSLNRIGNSLPALNVVSRILYIGTLDGMDVKSAFGFREFDSTTEFQVIQDHFELSNYDLIVIESQPFFYDDFVKKISTYVDLGGNVIFKGNTGIGYGQILNAPAINASIQNRTVLFPFESGLYYNVYNNIELISLNKSVLNTEILPLFSSSRISMNFTLSQDWEIIQTRLKEENDGFWPLSIYHNKSDPSSGSYFFYGFDPELDKSLYHPLINAYLTNRLNIDDVMTPVDFINILALTGTDNKNQTIVGIISDEKGGKLSIEVNTSARGLPESNKYIYSGFTMENWLGDSDGKRFKIISNIKPFSAQRWKIADDPGSPNFNVYVSYPQTEPITNENIPIFLHVVQTVDAANISGFKIKLVLPDDLSLSLDSSPQEQNIKNSFFIDTRLDREFGWQLRSNKPGFYSIGVEIKTTNSPHSWYYRLPIRIYAGKVEVIGKPVQFILGEEYNVTGTIIYHGEEPQTFEIWSQIYNPNIWGNVGGINENITLNSGDQYKFNYNFGSMHPVLNDNNLMTIFARNLDGTIYGEDFIQMDLIRNRIDLEKTQLNGRKLIITFVTKGLGYAENIEIQSFLNQNNSFKEENYGSLPINKSFNFSLEIPKEVTIDSAILDLFMTYNTHNKRHYRIAVTFSCLKSQPVTTTTTEPYKSTQDIFGFSEPNKSTQDLFGFSLGILVGVPITLTVLKRKLIAEKLKNFREQEK